MAHGDAREGKWRGNWRMEWGSQYSHTTSERGVSSITTADAHTSAASSRLYGSPRRFKWTRPFRRKTKSGFCACAITFQTHSSTRYSDYQLSGPMTHTVSLSQNKVPCIGLFITLFVLLARSQYPEGPATGHLDTGFSWFPCVYKRMLRWFPSFQVATTCLSCSPPDLNFLVTCFHICIHVK